MMELLMGNEAIAAAALAAGVMVVTGYPGTPSTEVLETVAKRNPGHVHVEWSVNEKAALEVAAGAAYAGARSMATMKQVGLNVASDPLMSLNYIGVKGGMIVLVADDPGPISSQTEQDTRRFGEYARIPVFDPKTPEDAYNMVKDAFACSEKYGTPVILRPTTRVCHSCASIDAEPPAPPRAIPGFERENGRYVIFPRLSYQSKLRLAAREAEMSAEFSKYALNSISGEGDTGVICGGVSAAYARDAINALGVNVKFMEVATPYPFPRALAARFMEGLKRVIVFEELDPVIEDALALLCGRNNLPVAISGKRDGKTICAGENTAENIRRELAAFLGLPAPEAREAKDAPPLPARPPVLCAGCPHRGAFYAVKRAMKSRKAVYSGDIGCYTLGNAQPLNMVDTCLCMGAGVTIAQGLQIAEPDTVHFAFIGDSTFFHSGITGVINAVYNNTDIVLIVLDNRTTAMTGHQPHPGTGKTVMGEIGGKLNIARVLEALGVESVRKADPLDLSASMAAITEAADKRGVRAVIFESPCAALIKDAEPLHVSADKCVKCLRCVSELGCPALSIEDGRAQISRALCTGCGLCAQVCGANAIRKGE